MTLIRTDNNINSKLIWTNGLIWGWDQAPLINNGLRFDWVNDFVTNNAGTPFTERDYTQPWTFFIDMDKQNFSQHWLFSTRNIWGNIQPWLYIWMENGRRPIVSMRWSNGSLLQWYMYPGIVPNGYRTLQITYTWSGNWTWLTYYVNGVNVATVGNSWANITATMINWDNYCEIWRSLNTFVYWDLYYTGKMQDLSFVNYVKTPAEILADHVAGTQSVWTWSYLFEAVMNQAAWLSFPALDSWGALTMDIQWQPVGDRVPR